MLGELPPPPGTHCLRELRLLVRGEVLPGRRRVPLLAHEEHRRERRREDECGADLGKSRRRQLPDPFTDGAVAHLVVGLQVAEELPAGYAGSLHRGAPGPAAERGVRPRVEEGSGHRPLDRGVRVGREVGVVALALAGQQGVHRVVEVVAPLARHPEPSLGDGKDGRGLVQVGLRDQRERTAERS